MADEAKTAAAYALKPGETTTEHGVMVNSNWWAKILMILGLISTLGPQIIVLLTQVPGVEQSKTGTMILSGIGALVTFAGFFLKATADKSYIDGRSLIKAAAVREVPPSTPLPPAV